VRFHELPLGPCTCGHPAEFHGDRAYGPCLRQNTGGTAYMAPFGGGVFTLYTPCGTCLGYKEDLGVVHKDARARAGH